MTVTPFVDPTVGPELVASSASYVVQGSGGEEGGGEDGDGGGDGIATENFTLLCVEVTAVPPWHLGGVVSVLKRQHAWPPARHAA